MPQAKKLFIAAVRQNSGKTTTSLCMFHLARKKYGRVGYFKPFGAKPVMCRGMLVDKDAALMAEVFGLEEGLGAMSPVVVLPGATRRMIDGLLSPEELQQKILDAFAQLEERYEYIVIEGSGHPGVGSIMRLSNARIARMLDAPVLLVTGGGLGSVVDELSLILALFEKERVDVRAILVNKLITEKREQSLDYLRRALKEEPLRVIGGLDYHPVLANPTLSRISRLLDLPLHGNRQGKHRIIHRVQVGGASPRLEELLQAPSLLILSSRRNEMMATLAKLYQNPRYHDIIIGLIISGSNPINPHVQKALDESSIPYLRAEHHTSAELYRKVIHDVSKITAEDEEKLDLIRKLSEQDLDFDAIDELFSLSPEAMRRRIEPHI